MRVLFVCGRHSYGDSKRGEGYEFANFLPALIRLGCEVRHFDSLDRSLYPGFAALNRALLEEVERHRPDVVLCVLMQYEVWLETLAQIRNNLGAVVVNWGTDDSWKYEQFARLVAPHVDLWATTSAEALAKARRERIDGFRLSQWAADAATLLEPLPADECTFDVSFVGSSYGNRPRWIRELAARRVAVECFGHGWPRGPVAVRDIARIVRSSRISLNFGDSGLQWQGIRLRRSRQIKARTFEVPGCGGFLLTETAQRLHDFFVPGAEIVEFADADDLACKVHYYLAHPDERDRIARAGHLRTRREHTYDARLRPLLDEAIKIHDSIKGRRNEGIDWRAFEEVASRHTASNELRLLRATLRAACRALWGPARSMRAARRLVFEISWRLTGARTYQACGWPGRMFYREG
jgi:spore maturation protein CgeB